MRNVIIGVKNLASGTARYIVAMVCEASVSPQIVQSFRVLTPGTVSLV